jgi:cytochrome c
MRMAMRRAAIAIGVCTATLAVTIASAQMPLPSAKPPDGAALFKQQCAVCHTIDPAEPTRQGPPLRGIVGRRAGAVEGFHYSASFAKADFAWDDAKLDEWITNPQAMIPGSIMAYRQAKPEVRSAIIAYLKELK